VESISSGEGESNPRKSEKLNCEKSSKSLTLEYIRNERVHLEEFLFNENNKISKNAIKFILSKWTNLESKLQQEIVEREKLCATYQNTRETLTKSYAQVASVIPVTENKVFNKIQSEVILIKPKDERDKRNNEEIKSAVIRQCSDIKSKIKIVKIRQMRRKGVVMEVGGKEDIRLVSGVDLDKVGLEIEKPKRISPSVMIYDVEEEYKEEELKEDLIKKNFDGLSEQDQTVLRDGTKFQNSFKTKENRVNWIVQIPGTFLNNILTRGKIYLAWQTYRIREFLNVVRCFKCQLRSHS